MDFGRVIAVAIGLFAMFFAVSVIASHILEIVLGYANARGRKLQSALAGVVEAESPAGVSAPRKTRRAANALVVKDIFEHPLVKSLSLRSGRKDAPRPSYVDDKIFARVVTLLADDPDGRIPHAEPFRTLIAEAQRDGVALEAKVEEWFKLFNDRVTGSYVRLSTFWLFVVGLLLAVVLKIDALAIANSLWATATLEGITNSISAAAGQELSPANRLAMSAEISTALSEVLAQSAAWPADWGGRLLRVLGWLLTAAAVSLGAQFWFNLLSEALKLRQTGVKPADPIAVAETPAAPVTAGVPAVVETAEAAPDGGAAVEGSAEPDDDVRVEFVAFRSAGGGALLGQLSSRYEVGSRGPGTVSTGEGDPGGVSYGSYQMSTTRGTAAAFAKATTYPPAAGLRGLQPGTKEFSDQWRRIAAADPEGFFLAQHAFVERTHYEPLAAKVRADTRIDVQSAGFTDALRNVVWSTAVQHGGATSIVGKAISRIPAADRSGPNFELRLIAAVYDERGRRDSSGNLVYFASSPRRTQLSVAARFVKEKQDAQVLYRRLKGIVTA